MAQNEQRDWKNEVSRQIAVYKTDKKLLELNDKLNRRPNFSRPIFMPWERKRRRAPAL